MIGSHDTSVQTRHKSIPTHDWSDRNTHQQPQQSHRNNLDPPLHSLHLSEFSSTGGISLGNSKLQPG